MQPSFLETGSHRLAYDCVIGRSPTVVFLSGFKSDMTGSKATALAADCAARGQGFIRFDYSGHGQSGGDFMEGTIGLWLRDVLAVIDELTHGSLVLVGSSMGGWLSLLAAIARPERVHALVGVASAPDFTERLIWDKLNDQQKHELMEKGVFYAPSCYGEEPYPITRTLIEEARRHLVLGARLDITCPVRLLHGTLDQDVPVEIAHLLAKKLPQASLTLIDGGDHRLSEKADLQLLCDTLESLL